MFETILFEHSQHLTIFLWHFTLVSLLGLSFLSFIIYNNVRDRVFLWHALYVGLLATYLACRTVYAPRAWIEYQGLFLYSYLVQVIYLSIYFHFGLTILNFKDHYPRFTAWIYRYLVVVVGIGLLLFVLAIFTWIPRNYLAFYYKNLFFPVHILIALLILYRALRLKQEEQRWYFLIGSVIFMVFGGVARLATNFSISHIGPFTPLQFFYMAIIFECTFFTIGLGIRVRNLYKGKLDAERQLNQVLRQEKELQILTTEVALLENKVLHSQMNSHFVFNVLNAIKASIVERDVENSVSYLNKFSKLIRRILDGSMRENATLADELKTIRLYLDVENIRLNNELMIEWQIDTVQPLDKVLFPALFLQPVIENAIWHGLLPSVDKRHLMILIKDGLPEQLEGEQIRPQLRIEILDNGVGYQHSLSVRQDVGKHRSYGMEILRERIARFNQQDHGYSLTFGIEDRSDESGTRVWFHLHLPARS